MENASKALLIAGGVLIAILLLTLFSYLYTRMREGTENIYSTINESEITEFNQKFLNYEGRGIRDNTTPLTAQDVATLINLAQDCKNDRRYLVDISIMYGAENLAETTNYFEWLEEYKGLDTTFKCTEVHVDESTLLVDRVEIEDH